MEKQKWQWLDAAHKKLAAWLLVTGLVYVLPLILADRYYNDDLGRTLWGATGWVGDGRPLAEVVNVYLNGGMPLTDIAPLPLLAAVLLLALALAGYAQRVLAAFPCDGILWYALFLVLADPLLLHNLSYRYDCFNQIGGIALALFVFALLPKLPWICAVLAGIVLMMLYQPLLGFIIGLWCIDALLTALQKNSRPLKMLTAKTAAIGAGAVIYMAFLAQLFVDREGWRHEASQLVGLNGQIFHKMYVNLYMAVNHIRVYLSSIGVLYKAAFVLLFLLGWGAALYACRGYIAKRRWLSLLAVLLAPAVSLVLVMAPFMLLENFEAGSRLLIAFAAVLLLLGVYLLAAGPRLKKVIVVLLIPCVIFHYTYVYTYGNAMRLQKDYETSVGTQLAQDLGTLAGGEPFTVSFANELPRPMYLRPLFAKYPNFNELIPIYFDNSTWLGGAWLYWFMPGTVTVEPMQEQDEALLLTAAPACETSLYACYAGEGKLIVRFK